MTEAADSCDGLEDRVAPEPVAGMPPDVPALKVFYLYLSAGCNLCCRHCWITPTFVHGKPVPAECLDFNLLKGAVAEAKPMGLSSAKLTGGEPTLHPAFRKIADFLTGEGLELVPCGACRQWIAELAPAAGIYIWNTRKWYTPDALLPVAFSLPTGERTRRRVAR